MCMQIIEVGYNMLAVTDNEGSAGKEEEKNQGKEIGYG